MALIVKKSIEALQKKPHAQCWIPPKDLPAFSTYDEARTREAIELMSKIQKVDVSALVEDETSFLTNVRRKLQEYSIDTFISVKEISWLRDIFVRLV